MTMYHYSKISVKLIANKNIEIRSKQCSQFGKFFVKIWRREGGGSMHLKRKDDSFEKLHQLTIFWC